METLRKILDMWLNGLWSLVTHDIFTSVIWFFILAMTILLFIKLWRGAWSWN